MEGNFIKATKKLASHNNVDDDGHEEGIGYDGHTIGPGDDWLLMSVGRSTSMVARISEWAYEVIFKTAMMPVARSFLSRRL